jgi:hypothetical protein
MPACKTCGENITWTEPEKGKWVPVENDGYTRHKCMARAQPGRVLRAIDGGVYSVPPPQPQPQPLPYNTPAKREPDVELAHQLNRVADSLDRASELMREFLRKLESS